MCHDVFTNVSNTAKKRIPPFPKTLTLVAKLISRDKDYLPLHGLLKMKKMVQKAFYAEEACKHEKVKFQPCGLYIDKTRPFIAASPDIIMHCKYHGQSVVEIKCPQVLRNKTLCDTFNECFFLTKRNGKITLKEDTQILHPNNITNGTSSFY